MLQRTRLFSLAESLGGVESLIGHPATMTHASIPREIRTGAESTTAWSRLSVGIEDIEDLRDDLAAALSYFGHLSVHVQKHRPRDAKSRFTTAGTGSLSPVTTSARERDLDPRGAVLARGIR